MKKRITIILGLITILLVSIIGASYALFTKMFVQEGENGISTLNCLDIKIENKDGSGNASAPITLINAYPIKDTAGLKQEPYNFTITNKCNVAVEVEVNLETLSASTLSKNYVKYNINNNNYNTSTTGIVGTSVAGSTVVNSGATSNTIDRIYLKANTASNVETDTPSAGASTSYSLRLWLNESTTWEQANNKRYEAKIVIVGTSVSMKFYTPEFSASEGTLLYALKNGNYNYMDPITIPGEEISAKYENIIAKTPDDYGTSYYFRGNVPNNYVMFAGRCWRIVRIDGNRNIKLWLWNDSNSCEESNVTERAYSSNISNGYIGFMYGNLDSNDFATANETGVHDNVNDSSILKSLKTWYKIAFEVSNESPTSSYTNLLADVIWCNDKKLVIGTGLGKYPSTYGFYGRKTTPSLVCQDAIENDVNNISRFTAQNGTDSNNQKGNGKLKDLISGEDYLYYKIGLVTADEVTFAGGKYETNNTRYYMYTGGSYWTLSPAEFTGSNNHPFKVLHNGALNNGEAAWDALYFHPSVSLIPSAQISNGIGTSTDPYIINVE